MIQTSEAAKPASYNAKALRRLDFRVVGKSCAVCLMKIQRTMKTLPGVVKVAVMLRKPYGGVIVYDSSKVSKNKLLETVLAQDKDVRVEQQIDNAISKVPSILIPLYGIPKTSAKNASDG
jgi:copper chaperone CopZ